MDETINIVSSRTSTVEGISISIGESLKNVGTTSFTNNSGECSVSLVESEKKNQRSEICSVYSGQKPTVYINPIVQTECTASSDVSVEVDVDQSKLIGSEVSLESTQSAPVPLSSDDPEINQLPILEASDKKTTKVVDRRRRTQGTILWEPLLVPSEMDGKIEMVTALKRVDSDYISAPRINPKKRDVQFVKQTPFKSPSKVLQTSVSPVKPAKPFQSKVSESSEKHPHVIALAKHRAGSNIKVQMDKAIAEKEASILKEIEYAMREAAKVKSKSSSVQPSSSIESKVSNEKRKVTCAVTVATPGSTLKKKKSKEIPLNTSNDIPEQTMDFPASSESMLESSSLPHADTEESVGKEDANSRFQVFKNLDVLPSTSPTSNVSKDSGSSGKIITTLGTVVASSITNGSELQGMPKLLTLPSKVPPPLAPLSKDAHPVNRIVTSPSVNSNSSSQLQRILVLTTPTGVKNVGADGITLMPITSMPMTPIVTTSSLALPSSSVKQYCGDNGIMNKATSATEKIENPQDVHLIVTNLPLMSGESVNIGGNGSHLHGKGISLQPTVVDTKKTSSQPQGSRVERTSNLSLRATPSIMKGKQKPQKSMNRELASLVIDCNNVQPTSSSVLRARTTRTSPKSVEDKSRNIKIRTSRESLSSHTNESKKSTEQKTPAKSKNNLILGSEQECSPDKKRQKSSPSSKSGKKSAGNLNNADSLKERLESIEQLYGELPPAQPHISVTTENFDKLKNSIQSNLHGLGIVAASIKNYISVCKLDSSSQLKKDAINKEINIVDIKSEVVTDKVLCRLCGGLFKRDFVVAFFSNTGREKNLISMFNTILPQSPAIKELDGLPQQICLTCSDKLTLCFNIINQFLKADKELRHVLHGKNDSMSIEGDEIRSASQVTMNAGNHICSEEPGGSKTVEAADTDVSEEKSNETEKQNADSWKRKRNMSQEKENSSDLKKSKVKGVHSELVKRPIAVYSAPNHKHKRKRSKSPDKNEVASSSDSGAPLSSTGCIDLSRLDPEFNVGFEVEWCLDEETIRSSLVPEDDIKQDLPHEQISANDDLLKRDIKSLKTVSPYTETSDKIPSSNLVLEQKKSFQEKDEHLVSEKTNPVDEVSKLPEMHPSIHGPLNTDKDNCSEMASEDNSESYHFGLFQSQETFKCSYCPLSFPNKQEAFLHKVMKHEEELESVIKTQDTKFYSSNAQKARESPKKLGTNVSVTKIESKSRKPQQPTMCDQCGLAFPNEYSHYIHKCFVHENFIDSHTMKDSKGVGYKILQKNELVDEGQVQRTTEEVDGKILVKCGTGMLWVSSSKCVSEEQKTTSQTSDGSAVANVSVENHVLSIEPEVSTYSVISGDTDNVENLFKCDDCNLLFPENDMLSKHLSTHKVGKFCCNECKVKFASQRALHRHISVHVPSDQICDQCGLVLVNKKLLQHKKEHTRNLPHVCEFCGKRFPNEQTLEVHESIHFNKGGPFSCVLCRKCFFFKHSLVRHRSQHASNRLQKCSLCFRVLNSCDQLRKHVALHHLTKNFVCFCKQTFPSQKELVEHRYLKHTYAEIFCARNKVEVVEPFPLHQCGICFRVLTSKRNLLKHHLASHKTTWPFYCIQCAGKYISKSHLAKHQCHRKFSSCQCKICGKIFHSKVFFQRHKKIHNSKK